MLRSRVAGCLFFGLVFLASSLACAQTLSFDPDPHYPLNEEFSLPLVIEAGGLDVKGVECYVTFDPAIVSLDSIVAGPWYTDSGQNFFFWDYTIPGTNTLHFASAMLDGTNNIDDILAVCYFSLVSYGTTVLDFTQVDVRDVNNDPLSFATDDGLIVLDHAVETDPVHFGTLKAVYR